MKVKNIFTTLLYLLLIAGLSFGIVYVLNKETLTTAQNEVRKVGKENFADLKASIVPGDIVEVTGTPNLLKQVSQEVLNEETEDSSDRVIDYYYAGLTEEEYGYDVVVRMKPGKLKPETQTFEGKVILLSQTEFGSRIKNSLNKAINFDELVNQDASVELDSEAKSQIGAQSTANFTNSTLLLLDEEVVAAQEVELTIAFWSIVLGIFLTTLFRKRVFGLR